MRHAGAAFATGSTSVAGGDNPLGSLPKPIQALVRYLYHVRCGPVLGPALQHGDDLAALRVCLLRGTIPCALQVVLPRLYSVAGATGGSVHPEPVPLTTLSLRSDRFLLLDRYTRISVWSGADVATATHHAATVQACAAWLRQATAQRLPVPELQLFKVCVCVPHAVANQSRLTSPNGYVRVCCRRGVPCLVGCAVCCSLLIMTHPPCKCWSTRRA